MKLFDFAYFIRALPQLLSKVHITILVSVISYMLSLIVGLFTAIIKIYKVPILNRLASAYISIFRGTPVLVQLFVVCFGIPKIIYYLKLKYGIFLSFNMNTISPIYYAVLALAINYGAYMAETIRTAIEAVGIGQMEAALSVGMTYRQAMLRIIIPQTLVIAMPSIGNGLINAVMESSFVFAVGVVDVMGQAAIIGAREMAYIEVYITAAVIYYLLCHIVERVFTYAEKKMRKYHKKIA